MNLLKCTLKESLLTETSCTEMCRSSTAYALYFLSLVNLKADFLQFNWQAGAPLIAYVWSLPADKIRGQVWLLNHDFLSYCEWGGGRVRRLVVNVSSWAYSSGRKTLIAFQLSCAGWNTSCDTFSLSSSLWSLSSWAVSSSSAWGSISYDPAYRGWKHMAVCRYLHQQTTVNW